MVILKMTTRYRQFGFSLVEIIVVVAVIAILTTIVISTARRIQSKADEQLAAGTIAILDAAIEQFADYGYRYKHSDFDGLKFPLDCSGFDVDGLEIELSKVLDKTISIIEVADHEPAYSGIEAAYFLLSRVPDCRGTLGNIDKSLLVTKGKIVDPDRIWPLVRIVDPWGLALRYSLYDGAIFRNFPLITSAGPDRQFDTADDITNK